MNWIKLNRATFVMLAAFLVQINMVWAQEDVNNPPKKPCGGCSNAGSGSNSSSVNLAVSCGKLKRGSLVESAHLLIEEHEPSALTATPQALSMVIGNYVLKSVNLSGGARELVVLRGGGESVFFKINSGSSIGKPTGVSVGAVETIKMLDSGGVAITDNPFYYELNDGRGNRYRFFANSTASNYLNLESMHMASGQDQFVIADMGLDVIRDGSHIISQVKSPSKLLNIVVEEVGVRYRVDIYPAGIVGGKSGGSYPVPSATPTQSWVIENPGAPTDLNVVTLTEKVGDYISETGHYRTENVTRYEYDPTPDAWTMTMDGDPTKTYNRYSEVMDSVTDQQINTRTIGHNYGLASQTVDFQRKEFRQIYDWGTPIVREELYVGAGKPKMITTYGYYLSDSNNGYMQRKSLSRSDGYTEFYSYDNEGRLRYKYRSYEDSDAGTDATGHNGSRFTEYRYNNTYVPSWISSSYNGGSVEPAAYANRVNEEIEWVVAGGVQRAISETATYYRMNGDNEILEIEIKVTGGVDTFVTPGGLIGMRTVKTYYASDNYTGGAWGGKLKSIEYPDGRLDEYTYYAGNYSAPATFTATSTGDAWCELISHKAWNGSAYVEVVNQSTRDTQIWDRYGNRVLKRREVYATGGYETIGEIVAVYDDLNHATTIAYLDGTTESGEWATGCCGMDSGTDRDGITTTYTYDKYKRIETMTRNGITTTYSYDGRGRILSTSRTDGGSLTLTSSETYDALGRTTSSTDESGLVTTTEYNDANRTETTTYPGLGTSILTKYKDGRIMSITGTAVVHEFYDYNVENIADWCETTKKYIGPHDPGGTSSPRWEKTIYDMVGRVMRIERPAYGSGTSYTANIYNGYGQLESKTEGVLGGTSSITPKVTRYEYDDFGNMKRMGFDRDGNGPLVLASRDRITDYGHEYAKEGSVWYRVATTVKYPVNDSGVAQTYSIRKTQLTGLGTVDVNHGTLVEKTIDIDVYNQPTINSSYVMLDDAGTSGINEQKVTKLKNIPSSVQDAITITRGGWKKSETSTTGVTTSYLYDGLGRIESQTVNSSADDTPNDKERSVSSTYAYYAATDTGNDELLGKLKSITDAADNTVTYTYYTNTGLKKTEEKTATLAGGSTQQDIITEYTYYSDTGKLRKVEGEQYPVEYDYDNYGQMDTLTTWRNETDATTIETTTWLFDPPTGLLTQKNYDDDNGPTYDYWSDGKLKSRTWKRTILISGQGMVPLTASYDYTPYTRELSSINYNDSTPDVSYADYDRMGLPHTVTDGQGTRSLTYNASGRLDRDYISGVYDVDRDFDAYGRASGYVLFEATPSQDIDYTYDANGRFKRVVADVDGEAETFTYTWADGADLLTGYSTQGSDFTVPVSVAYGYEPNRNLKTSVVNQANGAHVSTFAYLYDEIGRRKQRDDTLGANAPVEKKFNYNERSEVVGADLDGNGSFEDVYSYDDIGNRDLAGYVVNNLNQYDSINGTAYGYDDDGNLTGDGVWSYEWNSENLLVSMEMINKVDGSIRLAFRYDFMGRRYQKQVYVYNSSTSNFELQTSNLYVYDGWNMIHEADTDNATSYTDKRSYVWGLDLSQTLQGVGGVGGLLCTVEGGSTVSFAHGDANGNITDYIDGSSGSVVAHFEYDAFGQVDDTPSAQNPQPDRFPIRFSSKFEDFEAGLNYYGYRYYDPELGRWLNRDLIEELGGVNLYANTVNNAIDHIDLLGLKKCCNGQEISWMDKCCKDQGEYTCGANNICCKGTCIKDKKNYCCANGQKRKKRKQYEAFSGGMKECINHYKLDMGLANSLGAGGLALGSAATSEAAAGSALKLWGGRALGYLGSAMAGANIGNEVGARIKCNKKVCPKYKGE